MFGRVEERVWAFLRFASGLANVLLLLSAVATFQFSLKIPLKNTAIKISHGSHHLLDSIIVLHCTACTIYSTVLFFNV